MQNSTYTLLENRKLFLRRMAITTAGVALAWYVGSFFEGADSLVASIMCFITLQFSLQNSVKEGISQLIGAGVGAGSGLIVLVFLESRIISAGVVAAISILVAKVLKLGMRGSMNIGITGLIILGPGDALNTVYDRVWGTVLGVSVGVVLAYWIRPDTPQERVQKELSSVSKEISCLLKDISKFFESGISKTEAIDFLEQAGYISNKFTLINELSAEALELAAWNPFFSKQNAQDLKQKVNALERIAVQVRILSRSIIEYKTERDNISETTSRELVTMLNRAADAVLTDDFGLVGYTNDDGYAGRIENLTKQISSSLRKMKETDDTQELLLGLGVVNSMAVIEKSLQAEARVRRKS